MEAPQPGGGTLREHLIAVKNATGKAPPELQVPEPPPELHFVLPVWRRLSQRRPYGEGGVQMPVRYGEMEAFCRLSGVVLRPWEVEAIEILDTCYLAAVNSRVGVTPSM